MLPPLLELTMSRHLLLLMALRMVPSPGRIHFWLLPPLQPLRMTLAPVLAWPEDSSMHLLRERNETVLAGVTLLLQIPSTARSLRFSQTFWPAALSASSLFS